MRGAPLPFLLALAGAFAAAPGPRPAAAQDAPEEVDLNKPPPPPLSPEEDKAARALFAEAKALVGKGYGIAARKKFEEFLKKYPGADEAMLDEADDRSGPNFLAGITLQHEGGPPARRVDVELMADGYTLELFRKFEGEALSQMKEFWKDPLFAEYADYFNIWRFDLVSKEEGVDDISMEERGMPPPDDPRKRRSYDRKKKKLKTYSTALNCKAAGPQRQVWADPEQVMRWRQYLEASDGLTIAFARKGELGMGGGGIATTGRKVAVVHEFGHAFIGLLDEYTNNPNRPDYRVWAPNAVSTDDPDPRKPPKFTEVPWAHWFKANGKPIVQGVDILLGGATYQQGCFRPAGSCAMNSAGAAFLCWVCREAGVLKIYTYVSPVDESGPAVDAVTLGPGESKEFFVVPMQPARHDLKVTWTIQTVAAPVETVVSAEAPPEDLSYVMDDRAAGMWQSEGARAAKRRANPLPEGAPPGAPLAAAKTKVPGGGWRHAVKLEKLPPGHYRLTARVVDDTVVPGFPNAWVVKDVDRLREEWRTWSVEVLPAAAAPPAPTPPAPGK